METRAACGRLTRSMSGRRWGETDGRAGADQRIDGQRAWVDLGGKQDRCELGVREFQVDR